MRKNIKRLLAVLMVMAMIISMCSTALAAGHGSKSKSRTPYKGWQTQTEQQVTDTSAATEETTEVTAPEEIADEVAEDLAVEETGDVTVEEPAFPALEASKSAGGFDVSVSAPEGALPEGTDLDVSEVDADEVEEAVASVIDGDIAEIAAVDISFAVDDSEVEPEDGTEVEVILTSPALKEGELPSIVHILDDGNAEFVNAIINQEEGTATFKSGTFSTFTVVWRQNNANQTVTVHHGIIQNGSFVEFGTSGLPSTSNNNYPTSLNVTSYNTSNNHFAYLIYDFDGYTYSETRLNNATTGNTIQPVLRRNGTNNNSATWQYRRTGNNQSFTNLANGNNIYVIYTKKTITQGSSGEGGEGGGEGGGSDYVPDVGKKVSTQKSDGTYDVTLDVVGDQNHEEILVKARVIVILDLSRSMNYNWAGGSSTSTQNPSRMTYAKRAITALTDELLNLKDDQGNPLVEMGLVTFSDGAQIRTFNGQQFTSNKTTYDGVVNGLNVDNCTNWEAGLNLANSMQAATDSKTYIVFISDGNPTYRYSRGNHTDQQLQTEAYQASNDNPGSATVNGIFGTAVDNGSGNSDAANQSIQWCYDASKDAAKAITDANKVLYVVGLSSVPRMADLATYAGGTYKAGDEPEEFAESMADIAKAISEDMDLSNVVITDGVTEMSQVQTDALIGTAGDFVYTQNYPLTQSGTNYTYQIGNTTYNVPASAVAAGTYNGHTIFTRTDSNGATITYIEYDWNGAPEAELTESNSVVWNTSSATLTDGVLYRVKFTVWPKQEAYDLIADLSNQTQTVTSITESQRLQLRVTVNGSVYEYANGSWTGGLTNAQMNTLIKNAIDANPENVHFSMKTNTGLSASYTYAGQAGTQNYTNYVNGDMSLEEATINIVKEWHNEMDAREANDVQLTVTQNDGETTKDYIKVTMGTPTKVNDHEWIQEPEDNIFISSGLLSYDSSGNISVKESGYDYTVTEPVGLTYHWDLTADVYHPMVINGTITNLIVVPEEDMADLPASIKNLADNKRAEAGGKVYYKFGGELYVAQEGNNTLLAQNDRRSNLFVHKVVEETDAPADALFPITVTLENENAPYPDDEGYDVEHHTMWFYVSTVMGDSTTLVDLEDDQVDGATRETGDTGYWYFDNGGTVTVSLKAGQYINFINLPRGTTYEIEEETDSMADGFILKEDGVATAADNKQEGETSTPGTVDEDNPALVTGTIDKPNTDYTVDYTNQYVGNFYVYHSSDNTIEKLPLAAEGELVTEVNIFEKTKAGTLYGGYYDGYAGAKATDAQINETATSGKITYTNGWGNDATGCSPYSYAYIKDSGKAAWNAATAYTVSGDAVEPEKNTVYYLKEVPTGYLQPYTYYTYFVADETIADMWAISALDDLNYTDAGFYIIDIKTQATNVVSSLSIKAENSSTAVKLTANKSFAKKGVKDGYLSYVKISDKIGSKIMIRQYWVTPDGIEVFGTHQRELDTSSGTKSGIGTSDTAYTKP